MMKIEGVFHIPGRRTIVSVKPDGEIPPVNTELIRVGDGVAWAVLAVEMSSAYRPGASIGLVLRGDSPPSTGDQVFWAKRISFDLREVMQILRKMGHDVTCGSCMCQAFTGTHVDGHTCK